MGALGVSCGCGWMCSGRYIGEASRGCINVHAWWSFILFFLTFVEDSSNEADDGVLMLGCEIMLMHVDSNDLQQSFSHPSNLQTYLQFKYVLNSSLFEALTITEHPILIDIVVVTATHLKAKVYGTVGANYAAFHPHFPDITLVFFRSFHLLLLTGSLQSYALSRQRTVITEHCRCLCTSSWSVDPNFVSEFTQIGFGRIVAFK